jgi:hypothetical protein
LLSGKKPPELKELLIDISTVIITVGKAKVKQSHYRPRRGPEGSRRLRLPIFQDNRHMKVVSLSSLRTGRFYPPVNILVFISVRS